MPRNALVIGNSRYADGAGLPNAGNDARAMANALRESGFSVALYLDLDQRGMEQAIESFADFIKVRGGVALFYYSGHAFQAQGRSYLAPVGVAISSETDARFKTVDVEYLMGHMEEAGSQMKIVILDACRDNPFTRGFRSRGQSLQGLSRVDAPTGTIIAYATSPGKTAADGDGDHSPYTQALLEVMLKPGLPLEQTFKEVRIRVAEATHNGQIPWESSSLLGEFYFVPTADAPTREADAALPSPTVRPTTERLAAPSPEGLMKGALDLPGSQIQKSPAPDFPSTQSQPEKHARGHVRNAKTTRKNSTVLTRDEKPESNEDFFTSKAKDIEQFLRNPKTGRKSDRKIDNDDPYFRNLSSDMQRFLRR